MNHKRRQLLLCGVLGSLVPRVRAACKATEPNSLGPFYRRDAPFRIQLSAPEEPGQILEVNGRVMDEGSCAPMPGVIVDVWHANSEGRYYDVGEYATSVPDRFRLRGRMKTNEKGEYRFDTILPGTYGSRPKHIHYVVHHPNTKPLITQLYFEGDPFLASDFLARDSLVRPLESTGTNSLKSNFDIVLRV